MGESREQEREKKHWRFEYDLSTSVRVYRVLRRVYCATMACLYEQMTTSRVLQVVVGGWNSIKE